MVTSKLLTCWTRNLKSLYFNRVILAIVLRIVERGREGRSRGCYKNRGEQWAVLDYEMITGERNICIWKFGWQGASKICWQIESRVWEKERCQEWLHGIWHEQLGWMELLLIEMDKSRAETGLEEFSFRHVNFKIIIHHPRKYVE